jgi:Tfp pilus assembly protein PilZ
MVERAEFWYTRAVSSERRAHPRFACDLEAHIATPGGMMLDARTIDISWAGICVTTAAAVQPGNNVDLSLKLILDGMEADSLVIPGKVIWCTPTEGQFQVGAGFREAEMADASRNGLDVLLKFLSGELEVPRQGDA